MCIRGSKMKKLTIKRIFKWCGITLGGLLAIAVALISAMYGTFYFVSFLSHGFYKGKGNIQANIGCKNAVISMGPWSCEGRANRYFSVCDKRIIALCDDKMDF